ncbi:unnamed protein product [Camellia sinensis]
MVSKESHLKHSSHYEEDDDEAFAYALQLSTYHIFSTALNASVELKLFDIVAGAGTIISAAEIASRVVPTTEANLDAAAMLDRLLSLLVSHSLFSLALLIHLKMGRVRDSMNSHLLVNILLKTMKKRVPWLQWSLSPSTEPPLESLEKEKEERMVSKESHLKHSSHCEEGDDEAYAYALQLSTCHIFFTALNAAVELKLFDIVAGAGTVISAVEITSRLVPTAEANPDAAAMLDRLLCLLVSHSLLTCSAHTLEDGSSERLYGLAPAGKYFVENDEEKGSLAPMVPLAFHRATFGIMAHLKDAILEGGNQFKKVHGMTIFQYMDVDPTLKQVFNRSMATKSSVDMKKILETYKGFEGLTSLVDVGGGIGTTLNVVVSKYPSIKGINFDLPWVIKSAPSYPGIEHAGGDMLTAIPNAEAIMIKNVLHNWKDEQCVRILKNCYKALPEKGKVLIIDIIMPETPDSSVGDKYATQLDNIMLLQPGGKERTKKELETLFKSSGFSNYQFIPGPGVFYVMELYK